MSVSVFAARAFIRLNTMRKTIRTAAHTTVATTSAMIQSRAVLPRNDLLRKSAMMSPAMRETEHDCGVDAQENCQ